MYQIQAILKRNDKGVLSKFVFSDSVIQNILKTYLKKSQIFRIGTNLGPKLTSELHDMGRRESSDRYST